MTSLIGVSELLTVLRSRLFLPSSPVRFPTPQYAVSPAARVTPQKTFSVVET